MKAGATLQFRRRTAGLPLIIALVLCAPASAEEVQERFADEIHTFAVEDEAAPPPRCATLFLGSSSIRFWFDLARDMPMPLVKRGFGGATIADINHNFDRLVPAHHPQRIVFYAGENDIAAGKTPAEAFSEFEDFLARKDAALGETPVFFVSAKPSPARWDEIDAQREFNRLVRELAASRRDLVYIDVAGPMMEAGRPRQNIFISDRLHMNRSGYAIWRKAIGTALRTERTTRAPGCS